MFNGEYTAAAAAKSLQLCPTLCDPIDGSPPGSSVPVILQARTLEWVAISFSNAYMHAKQPTRFSVHRILQARTLECVAISFSRIYCKEEQKWKQRDL